jgi:hypothetical protein
MANPFRRSKRDDSRQQDWLRGRSEWRLLTEALLPPDVIEQIHGVVSRQGWLGQRIKLSASTTRSMAWLRRTQPLVLSTPDVHQQPFSAGLLPLAQAVCSERLCVGMTIEHFPWASLAALADGLLVQEHQTMVALTPARLQISTSQVELQTEGIHWPASALPQAAALCQAMGGELMQGKSGQLYLASSDVIDLISPMPELVVGQHLPDHEPVGQHASAWRQSINQLQMSLFEQSQADPSLAQTLWPWGTGSLPVVLHPSVEALGESVAETLPLHLRGLLMWLRSLGFAPQLSLRPAPVMAGLWQEQDLLDWLNQWLQTLEAMDRDNIGRLILSHPWSASVFERSSTVWSWRQVVDRGPWMRKKRPLHRVLDRLLAILPLAELD